MVRIKTYNSIKERIFSTENETKLALHRKSKNENNSLDIIWHFNRAKDMLNAINNAKRLSQ